MKNERDIAQYHGVRGKIVRFEGFFRWDKKRGEAARPFRLWDEQRKKNVQHRCFGSVEKARNAALLHTAFAHVGECYTVYDVRTGKMHWQFVRTIKEDGKAYVVIYPAGSIKE